MLEIDEHEVLQWLESGYDPVFTYNGDADYDYDVYYLMEQKTPRNSRDEILGMIVHKRMKERERQLEIWRM